MSLVNFLLQTAFSLDRIVYDNPKESQCTFVLAGLRIWEGYIRRVLKVTTHRLKIRVVRAPSQIHLSGQSDSSGPILPCESGRNHSDQQEHVDLLDMGMESPSPAIFPIP